MISVWAVTHQVNGERIVTTDYSLAFPIASYILCMVKREALQWIGVGYSCLLHLGNILQAEKK